LAQIPKLNKRWVKDGLSLKARAKMAWQFRHERRIEARSFMSDPVEVEMLRARDRKVYGSPDGPTFTFLVRRLRSEGLSVNEAYEAVIKGSYRTNAGFDKQLGI